MHERVVEKLLALNADHIQATPSEDLAALLAPFMAKHDIRIEKGTHINQVIDTLKPRSKTLEDMAQQALFYFSDEISYEEKAAKKFLKPDDLNPMQA